MNIKLISVGFVIMFAFELPCIASGQCRECGCPHFTIGWGYVSQTTYASESVPYFALHPPVYYGKRVARTYGHSPFAYPPGVFICDSEPSRAMIVRNAYATTPEEESKPGENRPLRIANPFVDQPDEPGVVKSHNSSGRQPQVVFPAAMAQRPNGTPAVR